MFDHKKPFKRRIQDGLCTLQLNAFIPRLLSGNPQSVIIYDIDNTLANTWPERVKNSIVDYERLPYFHHVLLHIHENMRKQDTQVIIYTVRPFASYFATVRWFKAVGLKIAYSKLFFFFHMEDKLQLIKRLREHVAQITVVDDLSFGHEKGATQFYDDIIAELARLDVNHIGCTELRELQEKIISIA